MDKRNLKGVSLARYKPVIEIDKNDEVGYRILNGLKVNREYHVKNLDQHKRGLLVKIGQSTSNIESSHPVIWHPSIRNKQERYIKLPPEIEIKQEKITSKKILFPVKRRKIV